MKLNTLKLIKLVAFGVVPFMVEAGKEFLDSKQEELKKALDTK